MKGMYKAVTGKDPSPDHVTRFRLECRRGDWAKTVKMIARTNKSINWHLRIRRSSITPVEKTKLYLFGEYLNVLAKTYQFGWSYPR